MREYKAIVILLRPIVYIIFGILAVKFGKKLIKRTTQVIGLFLAVITILGIVVLGPDLIAGFSSYDKEEVMQSVVGTIMLFFFALFAVGYLWASIASPAGNEINTEKQKKRARNLEITIDIVLRFVPVAAFAGFATGLYFTDSIVGTIIGATIQIISLCVAIKIFRKISKDHWAHIRNLKTEIEKRQLEEEKNA